MDPHLSPRGCLFFDPGEDGNGENGGDDIPDDPSDPGSSVGTSDGTSDDGDGQLLSEAASTEYGGLSVIGLSDTSSDSARRMIFWVGLLMIVYGAKIVFGELQSNKAPSK